MLFGPPFLLRCRRFKRGTCPTMNTIVFALLCGLVLPTTVAANDGWSTNQVLQICAVLQSLGSLFFGFMCLKGERSFFLFFGNFCCIVGDVVWVVMLTQQRSSTTWITFFLIMGLFNVRSLFHIFNVYRIEGCDSDSDSEEEGGNERVMPSRLVANEKLQQASKKKD